MRTSFADFSYDFNPSENIFIDLLKNTVYSNEDLHHLRKRKFNFFGCYPKKNPVKLLIDRSMAEISSDYMIRWLNHRQGLRNKYPSRDINIWFTFENRRPPGHTFDMTFSFDIDDYGNSNIYLPLIYLYLDLLENDAGYVRNRVPLTQVQSPRELSGLENRKFACAFINNPETLRLRVIDELRRIGPIDIFGRYSNNYVSNKVDVSSQYRFQVCLENDLYPGYITEKPLESWLAGSVPIYAGLDQKGILNPKALINLVDFQNLAEMIQYVEKVEDNHELLYSVAEAPLLNRNYGVQEILQCMADALRLV